ncbi:2-C-methyl-D-erythritol 4-phosphate cytidylyltransferase, partial [Corynebacterium glyciniphilum]
MAGSRGDAVDGLDRVYAVVAAAGSGTRLGEVLPKAFVQVGGRTILERCLDGLAASESVGHTVVTVSTDMLEYTHELVSSQIGLWAPMEVTVVLGGTDRSDSVRAGLEAVQSLIGGSSSGPEAADADPDDMDDELTEGFLVAVHDAARCL